MKKLMLYKGKAIACFLLLFLILINGCKKELLVPSAPEGTQSDKIRSIAYSQFISSIDLNSTGSLKEALSGKKAKLMSTQALDGNIDLEMDSVKKLTLGDTVSYVIAIKPQTPRATTFQNLTIQEIKTKTSAFLSTYYPDKEWIDNWRRNRKTAFKGTIVFNKIYLEDVESGSINNLEKKQTGIKDRMLASINGKAGLGNVISLMPGECEIYDVVTVVQQQCKFGHWNRGECDYLTIHPNWEPTADDWPPTTTISTSTVVNCAAPSFPSNGGGGGGGGSTTPNPPGTYNPCDGTPQPVGPGGISFEKGTRLMVGMPTDCDEIPGPPVTTTTQTPQQYLMGHLDLDAAELNFVNNPLNGVAVTDLTKYLINNGLSTDNADFVHWAITYNINNGYSEYVASLINGVYENQPDADAESTSTNFSFDNIETNFAFSSNGVNVYGNGPGLPDYPSSHPVSAAIAAYNPWIYLAFSNSNNTSIRHFHKQVRSLAGSDGWGKAIGAIGEGLAASRITAWPTSPGFDYRVGYMVGTTHLDGLQWGLLLKTSSGTGWGLNVVNSDLNGNEVITKMEEPDGPEIIGQKMARISYEIKTISPYNEPAYLWASFSEGIKQAEHRANSSGISASVLLFDTDSFIKLKNSTYGPQLLNRLAIMFSRKNGSGEQKVYLRLEKNLYANARSSYFALMGRIKNLPE